MYIILYDALKIIHLKLLLHTPKANGQIHAQNNNVTKDHQCASKRARYFGRQLQLAPDYHVYGSLYILFQLLFGTGQILALLFNSRLLHLCLR